MTDEWLVSPLAGMGALRFGSTKADCTGVVELYGGEFTEHASQYEMFVQTPDEESLAELRLLSPDYDWIAHFKDAQQNHVPSVEDDMSSWILSDGPRLAFYEGKLIEIACDPGDTRPWLDDIDLFTRPPQETLAEMIRLYGTPMYDGGDTLYWIPARLQLTGFVHGFNGDAPLFGPRSDGPEDKPSLRIDSPNMPGFEDMIKQYEIPFEL